MATRQELEIRNPEGRVSLFEETETMRQTVVWGPIGTEGVLNLLIDPDVSLYYGKMKVPVARTEFFRSAALLQSWDVDVIQVRDLLTQELIDSDEPLLVGSVNELRDLIIDKGKQLQNRFQFGDLGVLGWIEELLAEDVERYGERGAILLNQELAGLTKNTLPLGNIIFGRDQSAAAGNLMVWSKMSRESRIPEVDLYQRGLRSMLKGVPQVEVTGEGRFEGGDLIVSNGICYVGVGGRTNLEGVRQIAKPILDQGLRLVLVYHEARSLGLIEHQTTMHLDTFAMPYKRDGWVVYMDEAREREAIEITREWSGLMSRSLGSFANHLATRGIDIIEVSRDQQLGYQTNFVNLGENKVSVSLPDGKLMSDLNAAGVEVFNMDLVETTQGYGGWHCYNGTIWRGNK